MSLCCVFGVDMDMDMDDLMMILTFPLMNRIE